jgi:hypothetical protein
MPATQFGEIVVRVPKRGRGDQPPGGAGGNSRASACGRSACGTYRNPCGTCGCSGCTACSTCRRPGCATCRRPGCGSCGPRRRAAAAAHGRAARGDPPGLPGRLPLPLPGCAAGWRTGPAMPASSRARAFRRLPGGAGCNGGRGCCDRSCSARITPAACCRSTSDRHDPAAAGPVPARNSQYLQSRPDAVLRGSASGGRQARRLPPRQSGFDLARLPTGPALGEPLTANCPPSEHSRPLERLARPRGPLRQ